ncbi:hypothetical protein MRGA423_20715 [Mycobacterium tuberculosis RGTB423]|nr:hypothetical protein MRGA423_20715 [Mycobacterium tuberculosis RGTB423]
MVAKKCGLSDDDDVGVLMQHWDIEGHRHLVGQVAIQVHNRTGRQHRATVDHRTVVVDHLPGQHLRTGRHAKPCGQLG